VRNIIELNNERTTKAKFHGRWELLES